MSEQFYLTLSSDSPCGFNSTNNTSNFKVHLGRVLQLSGQWEVCLFEVVYPTTLFNLREDTCAVIRETTSYNYENGDKGFTGDMGFSVAYLDPGFYHSNLELINEINLKLSHVGKCQIDAQKRVKLISNTYNNAYSEHIDAFNLKPILLDVLGFSRNVSSGDSFMHGIMEMDLRKGLTSTLSVTTNIISDQLINNSHTKVLRTFQVNPQKYAYGFQRKIEFNKLVFLPVNVKQIECIEINIKDDKGHLASFTHGTLTVVLQFRKVGHE
jgi:hypothetical protein